MFNDAVPYIYMHFDAAAVKRWQQLCLSSLQKQDVLRVLRMEPPLFSKSWTFAAPLNVN